MEEDRLPANLRKPEGQRPPHYGDFPRIFNDYKHKVVFARADISQFCGDNNYELVSKFGRYDPDTKGTEYAAPYPLFFKQSLGGVDQKI